MATPAKPPIKPRALECPNCGAAVALRGLSHSLNAVCPNCLCVLDVQNEQVKILQAYAGPQPGASPAAAPPTPKGPEGDVYDRALRPKIRPKISTNH